MIIESLKLAQVQNPPPDMSILIDVSLSQPRQMGVPLGKFSMKFGLCSKGQDQWENRLYLWQILEKKQKTKGKKI